MKNDRYKHADQDRMDLIAQIRQGADLEELLITLFERENDRDLDRDPLSYTLSIFEEACGACDKPIDKTQWKLLLCGTTEVTDSTAWLGSDLSARIAALTPDVTHALFHYLVGYLTGNEEFKQALTIAALEGKL